MPFVNKPVFESAYDAFGNPRLTCGVCSRKYDDWEVTDDCWNLTWTMEGEEDLFASMCIECHEKDINRKLVVEDFTGNPVNKNYLRHCDACKTLFRVNHYLQWYCSVECGRSRNWRVFTNCGYCDRRFLPTRKNQRFCSHGCAVQDNRAEELTKQCAHCQEDFDTTNPLKRFCSVECARGSKRAGSREATCPICGDVFTASSKRVKYCNNEQCKREGFNRTRRKNNEAAEKLLYAKFKKFIEQSGNDAL